MFFRFLLVVFVATLILPEAADAGPQRPAKELFGYTLGPAPMKPRPIGFYTKGCLAGGMKLPKTGPAWQAMRLSRNRNWGHPVLVNFLKTLAVTAREKDGWPGLLVGDMSQPRGGPMLTGHRSHQIGLDSDIWLTPMPAKVQSYKQRERRSAISMLAKGGLSVDPKKWSLERAKLIRRAASDNRVARIFVHPAIKKALCESADKIGDNRNWLRQVRPWWGHHYHFHVRLKCPAGMRGCKNQPAAPAGDGCGKPVQAWLDKMDPSKRKKIVRKKTKKKKKLRKRRPLTLASLPIACTTVIAAGDKGRLKRLRYGVIGDIPAPTRNPKRGESSNLAWRINAGEVQDVAEQADTTTPLDAAVTGTATAKATTTGSQAANNGLPMLIKAKKTPSEPPKAMPFPNKAMPFQVKPGEAQPQRTPEPPKPGKGKSGKQSSGNSRKPLDKKLNLTAGAVGGIARGLVIGK